MRIALVSPVPPCPSPWASVAVELIGHLKKQHQVELFVEHPYRVHPDVSELVPINPAADLPHRLANGTLDVPIYLLGDEIHHLHQLRFLGSCPGIAVLGNKRPDFLATELFVHTSDGKPRPLFDEYRDVREGDGASLRSAIVGMSRAVIVTDRETLAQLNAGSRANESAAKSTEPGTILECIPGLGIDHLEPAQASKSLVEIAHRLPDARQPDAEGSPPSVQVVVVSYNSADIIAPCLESLVEQDYPNLRITVVDNASGDGTASYIRKAFPTVQVIDAGSNLGFAGGCNRGFAASDSKYIALLNQDAVARRNWITELVRVAELDSKIAAVGSKLLMDRCPTILNSTGIEINEAGWAWDRQVGEKDEDPSPLPEDVFGVTGGALLFRREALETVGGFDTAFFMYFEDTDLSWRLRLAGFRISYAPLAVVRHDFHGDSGATPGRALRRRSLSERNRLQTLFKNSAWRNLCGVLPRILKYDRGRIKAYKALARRGQEPEFHTELARMVRSAWVWNAIRLPSLLVRRRKVQKRARAREDVQSYILPGLNEGGHQGDVECFHDRFSARPVSEIRMGQTDRDSLGSGWHGVEQPPGAVQPYRWCAARSWFYLEPGTQDRRLVLKLASPLARNSFTLFVDDQRIGEAQVDGDIAETSFELPADLPRTRLWEFRLECSVVRPGDRTKGGDIRDLGLILFEMRLE